MQTETATPTVLTYDPKNPYHHARNAEKAIWRLPLTDEQKRSLSDLLIRAEREAFSRGLAPDRPLNY